MLIPFGITAAGGYLMNYYFESNAWLNFVIRGVIVVVVYLALTYFIGLNKNERGAINSYIARIFNKIFKRKISK
jgi:hypothetical protein